MSKPSLPQLQFTTAVTNAQFASLHGLPVALWPFDDARSTTQISALVTSGHSPECRDCGTLPSGGSAAGRCASAAYR